MYNIKSSLQSLTQMFIGKTTEYLNDIDNVHMVWLEEIEEEAHRIFSKDFNSEPELMPKTPSQKKNSRRKRVSLGRQEEQNKRRSSKGKRVNLRSSGIKSLNVVAEEESTTESPAPQVSDTSQPKRTTRQNMKASPDVEEATQSLPKICDTKEVSNKKPELQPEPDVVVDNERQDEASSSAVNTQSPKLVVRISAGDRLSAEFAKNGSAGGSPGRTATKIAIADTAESSQRRSVRHSLKLRHSLGGWRPSMTQESVRRASRRSIMKRKAAQADNSTCSGNVNGDSSMEIVEEDVVEIITPPTADTVDAVAQVTDSPPETDQEARTSVGRVTRSVAATLPALASAPLSVMCTPNKKAVATATHQPTTNRMSRRSTKRKAPDTAEESPEKQFTPPKKSQSAVRPNMRSFLHTVQKNQMLMMTPNTLGRSAVIKSFIKHTTPLKTDPKTKERMKLEALRKKQEQEEERMRKMEEEKRRKQEELRRKRDERLRRVNEAKVKEEQKEEEKKKKIEQKMAQIDDKRQAEEKAKKKVALKRQEELELKRKLEEEAKRKKLIQAEEEKRQQELLAKKAEEEELAARKVAEARRALELRREQERERERQAALEKEQKEREKALVLQRELEKAAREKERREQEEKRRLEELQRLAAEEKAAKEREAAKLRELANEKAAAARMAALNVTVDIEPPNASTPVGKGMAMNVTVDIEPPAQSTPVGKGTALNVTVDIEQSPQSYSLTPTNGKKAVKVSESVEDYGMDQNSDDSTDDESAPRKPVPSWAKGHGLQQILMKQYFNPPDFEAFFGSIDPPKLEEIFSKSKPRYFKRTSSAVWHSPPAGKN
ncbi:inner centromere protein A isoform X2 [Synchiropus splendidus]|uniref:inner centromere protein A isoform X2 n=1 Tax=Synchiropus splendidus TaxID=270530 RepID=UPI00237E7E4A|nr:inner centromere protein A isoform X2 [Synchiropus splendidus]